MMEGRPFRGRGGGGYNQRENNYQNPNPNHGASYQNQNGYGPGPRGAPSSYGGGGGMGAMNNGGPRGGGRSNQYERRGERGGGYGQNHDRRSGGPGGGRGPRGGGGRKPRNHVHIDHEHSLFSDDEEGEEVEEQTMQMQGGGGVRQMRNPIANQRQMQQMPMSINNDLDKPLYSSSSTSNSTPTSAFPYTSRDYNNPANIPFHPRRTRNNYDSSSSLSNFDNQRPAYHRSSTNPNPLKDKDTYSLSSPPPSSNSDTSSPLLRNPNPLPSFTSLSLNPRGKPNNITKDIPIMPTSTLSTSSSHSNTSTIVTRNDHDGISLVRKEVEEKMVLSKMAGQGSSGGSSRNLTLEEIAQFLRVYRTLECSCCDEVIGFQNRDTGKVLCTPGCSGKKNKENHVAEQSELQEVPTSTSTTAPSVPSIEPKPLMKTEVVKPVQVQAKPAVPLTSKNDYIAESKDYREAKRPAVSGDEDVSPRPSVQRRDPPIASEVDTTGNYRHISSVHRGTGSGTEGGIFNKRAGDDAVDNRAHQRDNSSSSGRREEGNGIMPASQLRKGSNPFHKNMPTAGTLGIPQSQPGAEDAPLNSASPRGDRETSEEMTQKKVSPPPVSAQKIEEIEAAARAAAIKERAAAVAVPKPQRFMWQDCKFSGNIKSEAVMKVTYTYDLNRVHLMSSAPESEELVAAIQTKVSLHAESGQAQQFKDSPNIDEMVVAVYPDDGMYYRARVVDCMNDKVKINFVDYGDEKILDWKEFFKMSKPLMEEPICGISVILDGIPTPAEPGKPLPKEFRRAAEKDLKLGLKERLEMGNNVSYRAVLAFANGEGSLNDVAKTCLDASRYDLFSEENVVKLRENIAYRLDLARRRTLESIKINDLALPIFRALDMNQVTLPLNKVVDGMLYTVSRSDRFYVAPKGPEYEGIRSIISSLCKHYLNHFGAKALKPYSHLPANGEVYIVKWLPWDDVKEHLITAKAYNYRKLKDKNKIPDFNRPGYKFIRNGHRYYRDYVGKYFRGFVKDVVSGGEDIRQTVDGCWWFCLIDIGISIPVPNKYIYCIDKNLLIPPTCTIRVAPIWNGMVQRSVWTDSGLQQAFQFPDNQKIQFTPITFQDNIYFSILKFPTEAKFLAEAKYKLPEYYRPSFDEKKWLGEEVKKILKKEMFKGKDTSPKELLEITLEAIKTCYANKSTLEPCLFPPEPFLQKMATYGNFGPLEIESQRSEVITIN